MNNKNILIKGSGSLMGKLDHSSPITGNFSIKNIYPNPFNAVTTVSIQAHEHIRPTLQLFDLKGSLLKENVYELRSNKNHFIRLSLDIYPTGLYFVRVVSRSHVSTKKIQLLK